MDIDNKDCEEEQTICCSFCGKKNDEVETIVSGPSAYICNECIILCAKIVKSKKKRTFNDAIEKAKAYLGAAYRWEVFFSLIVLTFVLELASLTILLFKQ